MIHNTLREAFDSDKRPMEFKNAHQMLSETRKKKNQKSRDEVGKSQSVIWNVYVEA
jgi:hypothetical protein